jgi:hypothetical protein
VQLPLESARLTPRFRLLLKLLPSVSRNLSKHNLLPFKIPYTTLTPTHRASRITPSPARGGQCGGAAAHTPDKAVVDCACNVCDCEGGCPLSCECTECCNDHVADCSCDCCPDGCKVDCACEKCGPHNCGHAHA